MTPEEQLLKEAKKLTWDIQNGRIIRSDGLKKAIEEVENDNIKRSMCQFRG